MTLTFPSPTAATFNKDMVKFFKDLTTSVSEWNQFKTDIDTRLAGLDTDLLEKSAEYRAEVDNTLKEVDVVNQKVLETNAAIVDLANGFINVKSPAIDSFTLSTSSIAENSQFTITMPYYYAGMKYELSFNPGGSTYVDNGNGTFTVTAIIPGYDKLVKIGIRQRIPFKGFEWSEWFYKDITIRMVTPDSNGADIVCSGSGYDGLTVSAVGNRYLGVSEFTANAVYVTPYELHKQGYNAETKLVTFFGDFQYLYASDRLFVDSTSPFTTKILPQRGVVTSIDVFAYNKLEHDNYFSDTSYSVPPAMLIVDDMTYAFKKNNFGDIFMYFQFNKNLVKWLFSSQADTTFAVAYTNDLFYIFYSDGNNLLNYKTFNKAGVQVGVEKTINSLPTTPVVLEVFPTEDGNINIIGIPTWFNGAVYGMQINRYGDVVIPPKQLLTAAANLSFWAVPLLDGVADFKNMSASELKRFNSKTADRLVIGQIFEWGVFDKNLNEIGNRGGISSAYAASGYQTGFDTVRLYNQFGIGYTNSYYYDLTISTRTTTAPASFGSYAPRCESPLFSRTTFDTNQNIAYFFKRNYMYQLTHTQYFTVVSDTDPNFANIKAIDPIYIYGIKDGAVLEIHRLFPASWNENTFHYDSLTFKKPANQIAIIRSNPTLTFTIKPKVS